MNIYNYLIYIELFFVVRLPCHNPDHDPIQSLLDLQTILNQNYFLYVFEVGNFKGYL